MRIDFSRARTTPATLLHFGDVDGTGTTAARPAGEFAALRRVRPAPQDPAARRRPALARPAPAGEFFLNFERPTTAAPESAARALGHGRHPTATTSSSATSATTGSSAAPAATRSGAASATTCSNADDDLDTQGGLNDRPDTHPSYEDLAFGGAGLDVLIANTGGDRLIDWQGDFNSFIVPFSPYGMSTVSRQLAPGLKEFLYALSKAQGADPTRPAETGADPARNGEPEGEIGAVVQKDPAWGDQTGGPRDPQGPIGHSGPKDVRRSADFNDGSMQAFLPDSGSWTVVSGSMQVSALSPGQDAVAVYYHDTYLPTYYEIAAQIRAEKPTAGWNANAYVVFDYHSPTNFKFAGINVSTNKYEMGYRDASGWHVVRQTNVQIKPGVYYNMLVAVNGTAVTVSVNGASAFEYVFPAQIVDGQAVPLNKGLIGLGSQGARGTFDNVAVQVLKPEMTLDETETFEDGVANRFTVPGAVGTWSITGGRLNTTPAPGATNLSLMDFGRRINVNNYLELTSRVRTSGVAGIVFDQYSAGDFKFVAIDVPNQRLLIGHQAPNGGWVVEHQIARTLLATQDYDIQLILRGAAISVSLNGAFLVSWGFNAAVVDGRFGLVARGGPASFDMIQVRSNDEAFAGSITPPAGAPNVSIGDATVTEGSSSSPRTVTLTLSLSSAATAPVSVSWTTAAATAMAGSDYIHAGGTVTFAPGQTSATITVTVVGDNIAEALEGFNILLSDPQGLGIADGTGNVGIVDDDVAAPAPPPPTTTRTLSVQDATVTEDRKNTSATITVTLSAASSSAVTVTVKTRVTGAGAGNAAAGGDFQQKTATVTFAPGQTVATFVLTIVGDRNAEGAETLEIVLEGPNGAQIARGVGKLTILDDDASLMAAEQGPGRIGARLSRAGLRRALAAAIRVWVKAGVKRSAFKRVRVALARLGGTQLAVGRGRSIVVDVDAAGWGWSQAGLRRRVAAKRIDLITVLVHELGHILGLEHSDAARNFMNTQLVPGVRLLPDRSTVRLLPKKLQR